MRLERYLAKSHIVDIKSKTLKGALKELLEVSTARLSEKLDRNKLLDALLARESTITTYLGNGVALPHAHIKMKRPFIFAIGRCPEGVQYDGMAEYKEVRLIVLLLAAEGTKNYLNVLSAVARQFQNKHVVDQLLDTEDIKTLRERVFQALGGLLTKPEPLQSRFNRLLLKEAYTIAKAASCNSILIFADTYAGGIEIPRSFPGIKTVMVTRSAPSDRKNELVNVDATIELRAFSDQRLSQLRSAVLIGLTRDIFKNNDRICCVGGIPNSNQLDTVVVVDIEREFQSVLTQESDLLPPTVKVEAVERMLSIATELAVQGREGKPVGCLFVIGDTEKVNTMVKPLVLNPFHGYAEVDRNILNPFMDETIKEFSSIDGAFIIRGNGVIESAGSLIHAPAYYYRDMPSGLGARHSAASAVSMATDCIAIVISASSGQVTLFRHGVMLPLIEKSVGTNL